LYCVEKAAPSQVAPAKKTPPQKETIECPVEQRDPKRTTTVRSNPTPSLDGSSHSSSSSVNSRKRSLKGSASALGLDKMIDEKRDAKSMSERVVHIEVRILPLFFVFAPLQLSNIHFYDSSS
jgi:hypothetical protein